MSETLSHPFTAASRSTAPDGPPLPIVPTEQTPLPIPMYALGPFREVVEAIAVRVQAPMAIGLQSVLGTASLCAQAHVDVETLNDKAPVSLVRHQMKWSD